MICPNQPLHWDAYSRFGSAGDPLMWYISQPAKCGPLTSHFSRLPSDVRMNAPLRVPTSTRTLLMLISFLTSRNTWLPAIGLCDLKDPAALAWIIHQGSSQKRKDALKGMMNTGLADPA